MAKRTDAATPATVALTRAGVPFTVHRYVHHDRTTASGARSGGPTSYGAEAAAALGVDPARIFKTLIVVAMGIAEPTEELVVAVVPVAQQLDLKALAATVGAKKAQLADPAAAQRSSGYVVGGISPVGQRNRLRTVVDASAGEFATIYVSAGRRGLQLQLATADLVRMTNATVAVIGR